MLVPAFWEALMLGCDDEVLGFCLEAAFGHLWVLSLSTPAGQQARLLVVIFRVSLQVIHVEEVDDLSSWGVI